MSKTKKYVNTKLSHTPCQDKKTSARQRARIHTHSSTLRPAGITAAYVSQSLVTLVQIFAPCPFYLEEKSPRETTGGRTLDLRRLSDR